MIKHLLVTGFALLPLAAFAQKKPLSPEQLWRLANVNPVAAVPGSNEILYKSSITDLENESKTTSYYFIDAITKKTNPTAILQNKSFVQWDNNGLYAIDTNGILWLSKNKGQQWIEVAKGLKEAEVITISPNGQNIAFSKHVTAHLVDGNTKYNDVPKSTAQIYSNLNYRHWDTWYNGKVSHVFIAPINQIDKAVDILKNEPFDVPTKPFGGVEDIVWNPNNTQIIYVCKKKFGKDYSVSTNTDIYAYDLATKTTNNLSEGMLGYDVSPQFSPDGESLAWLSMAREGYEADKNDLIILDLKTNTKRNISRLWDETIDGNFIWSNKGDKIFFNASSKGTMQLFSVSIAPTRATHTVRSISAGVHNLNSVVAQLGNQVIVTRTDMNTASEIYTVDINKGITQALTTVNDVAYQSIAKSEVKLRMVTTTDNKEMGVWVIYPPDFDSTKKYPTLLYCQGGPQSAVSQFYSVRWNFQLMAANGYIVVAPNRRGLPGWGVEWNEAISKDWGGQAMKDYLSAIDDISKESYVDKNRLGAVGASYGGYSVYMLAGIHQNRFKSFIAHCGLFDMQSWYGTTEEMWFANWDLGGNFWDNKNNKSYTDFNPSNYIDKWNTPILVIQGGLDFRVPTEQGLQAFKAAQMKGIKSKLLYFPNENHWVLHAHNGLVWQREFFSWLKETL